MLMRELDLIPGPRLGEVLREVRLAWEAEEVKTASEAMNLARAASRKALESGLG
jgi:Xaa-Pro aminopeptidase